MWLCRCVLVPRREGIEDVVLSKRRFTYEQQLAENPLNYDAWFDYIKLEESTGNLERIREVREPHLAGLTPRHMLRGCRRLRATTVAAALSCVRVRELGACRPDGAQQPAPSAGPQCLNSCYACYLLPARPKQAPALNQAVK